MDSRSAKRVIASLADAHTHELGFLPMQTIHALFDAGRIEVTEANDDPVGYLMRGPLGVRTRIYQACIRADARRQTFGSQTLTAMLDKAIEAKVHRISLWCAADLPANAFWTANGFQPLATRIKSTKNNRLQIGYELVLPEGHAHYARLNADGKEPNRSRVLDMLELMGADPKQAERFRRRRYD